LIDGHTDSTGSEAYNLDLSQRRAETVRDFLIGNGVSPMRLSARGFGEEYPVASNDTLAGRQQNRRVEVVVMR
jgi:outer membrane protein OmpA-like peptidoglycan-associated protein